MCSVCPKGAKCMGNTLPPIADLGYGLVTQGSEKFFQCRGAQRCYSNGGCDCLGGKITAGIGGNISIEAQPALCGGGYLDGSPLCAECDFESGFAMTLGECSACDWGSFLYLIIAAFVVVIWFPVTAYFCETFESLEITFAFLQFLGLYSNFAVSWGPMTQSFFSYLALFNLDVDMMHLACFENLRYPVLWCIQTYLVPVGMFFFVSYHLSMSWLFLKLVQYRLPPYRQLLALGFRPRRDYSLESIRNTYLPRTSQTPRRITMHLFGHLRMRLFVYSSLCVRASFI